METTRATECTKDCFCRTALSERHVALRLEISSWRLLLALLGLLQASIGASRKLVLELLDAASRVNELQLSGIKRVASTANVDLQLGPNAPSLKRIATATRNRG